MATIKEKIKNSLLSAFMICCRLVPIKKNKIVFLSYFGKYYNDNPRKISEALEIYEGVDLVWGLQSEVKCDSKVVRRVNVSSLKYAYELATAKVWVDNSRKREWVKKRKGQYYIQTWHGNLGNKKNRKSCWKHIGKRLY